MIRINLLPHREEKRQKRQRRFLFILGFAFLAAIGVTLLGYVVLSSMIDSQNSRNAFLAAENAKLDKQIAEIEKLKSERQALLDRKNVIERLQSNRTEAVRVLDQLVRQTPEGLYLKDFKQVQDQITLIGYAQSNARVSTYMRNLNDSEMFEQPLLIETKAVNVGNLRQSEFNLRTRITRASEASAVAASAPRARVVKK